ncbi:MAG: type II secretion system protein [Candidatus Dojkabacteria bacterium]|uniref:General secretion pathway GspH domain-containing protein n=2 Tax=Candidatus Dojkabacteria TaxID=74243 RepID=A0A136KJI1_9BACT|nr:MAG: hypothetical protein UZ20_WS6002000409 [candidate division WS6 bacterium OLB21]MBW7953227.1 type II secretion system protein [Candidatus Dojkabacteria bacterium]WKZ28372.1 MAG: type II secretion system protein [Candidatus Dojkabacteria bacterium]
MRIKAFTLIEVLLAISLFSLIFAVSAPFLGRIVGSNDLDVAVQASVQSLRRAQVLSQTGENDSYWGVYFQNGSITVFRGQTYLTRNPDFDEITTVSNELAFTGLSEVIFNPVIGNTSNTGSITITNPESEQWVISINNRGVIDY